MFTKKDIKNIYELTPLQEGMLFHALYDNASLVYFEQSHFHISGALNIPLFEQTWHEIVQRHDIFRTIFVHKNTAQPLQIVLKERKIHFHFEDIRSLASDKQTAHCQHYEQQDRQQRFDLTKDVLMRVAVFQRDEQSYEVIWTYHHILMDGWSLAIVYQELNLIYSALIKGTRPNLPPVVPFNRYIKWLKQQDKTAAKQYWQSYLNGYRQLATVPRLTPQADNPAFVAKTLRFELSEAVTSALEQLASRNYVTLNTVIQALWGVLLSQYNGREDVVFGATVSGRPADIKGIEWMVGLFINAIPIRVNLTTLHTFKELLQQLQQEATHSKDYHYYSLADIQADSALKQNLFDHILVFENYPEASETFETPFIIDQYAHFDHTNYDLTVQVAPEKTTLGFNIIYNQAVYDTTIINNLESHLRFLIDAVIANDDFALKNLEVLSASEKNQYLQPSATHHLTLAVAATFTAEPIEPFVKWWGKQFDLAIQIQFAPYNQVFQQLLAADSLLATNRGANGLFIRFEDWIRDVNFESEAEYLTHLDKNYADLVAILADKPPSIPTFVGIFPVSTHRSLSENIRSHIETLNQQWRDFLKPLPNVYGLACAELAQRYQITELFDSQKDKAGHLPFSDEYYAAVGTQLARQLTAWKTTPFKVIALDCDNTLWQGVCGEDGATGVTVTGGYLALQRFLLEKYNAGFLLVLCSKNGEQDVWDVFEQNEQMLLKREHIVTHRINWLPKSTNLLEMADELNLSLNSFIFIDDSGVECTEVMMRCPEILTLHLPDKPDYFAHYLQHVWAFDKLKVTAEDTQRTAMYQAEQKRQQQQQALSLDDFLRSLDIKVYINPLQAFQPVPENGSGTQNFGVSGMARSGFPETTGYGSFPALERVSQLTQRTNQFNLSTIRRTEDEINALIQKEGVTCWTIEVTDKFGDYGLVGVVIAEQREKRLFLDTLLLSCRVLGRNVEHAILSGLKQYCETHELAVIEAEYRATEKNQPILTFLEEMQWQRGEETETGVVYRISVETLPQSVENVGGYWQFDDAARRGMHSHAERGNEKVYFDDAARRGMHSHAERGNEKFDDAARRGRHSHAEHGNDKVFLGRHSQAERGSEEWTVTLANDTHFLHKAHYQPLFHHSGTALLKLPVEDLTDKPVKTAYLAPENEQQQQMATVWQAVLGHEAIGVNDNFLELGGHSLKATRIVSRIHKAFGVEVSLKDIFQYPTIKTLCEVIDKQQTRQIIKIEPIPAQAHYEVSHAQRRLWVLQQMEKNLCAYNTPAFLVIDGHLNSMAFKKAFEAVVKRHESLRTTFITVDGEPRQKIHEEIGFRVEDIDLSSIENKEELAQQMAEQEAQTPFDLTTGPLIRVKLLQLSQKRYMLILNLHHITSDGWSIGVLEQEVLTLYAASLAGKDNPLPPLHIQYKDYAAWAGALLTGKLAQEHQAYWHHKLSGELPRLNLPTDYPRPPVQTFSGHTLQLTLDNTRLEKLKALGNQHQASLFMSLVALIKVLLYHYSNQPDIIIGTPVAGRNHPDLENQIGFYINTLALRDELSSTDSFCKVLEKVKQTTIAAYDHQLYPFNHLVDELNLARDVSRSPLFDVMVVLQDFDLVAPTIPNLKIDDFEIESRISRFDLTFDFAETAGKLEVAITYNTDLYQPDSINRLASHFEILVHSILTDTNQPIGDLNILPDSEKQQILMVFNERHADYPQHQTLVNLFEAQVEKTPDNPAVLLADYALSYQALNQRANQLAHYLLNNYQIQADDLVALTIERSEWLLIGLLGILKAGGAYLPIDASYPPQRIDTIIKNSGCKALLTQLDIQAVENRDDLPKTPPKREISNRHLAYVIYTSGSTGQPKGVMIEHRGFVNMALEQIRAFGVSSADHVLQFASPSFDASLSEIFMALLSGAAVVPVSKEIIQDTQRFAAYLADQQVTVATLPPVYLNTLDREALKGLKILITAGGPAIPDDALAYANHLHYFNAYGPTETSVCASYYQVLNKEYPTGIAIGKPLANLSVLILNERLHPVPIGVVGEICVAGIGLARGYLNNPALTAEKFIVHPLKTGERLYKTGDLGRWLADGNIAFLGRTDEQVKIRGHRIEPDEVTHHLLRHTSVTEAIVLAPENNLVAYLVTSANLSQAELRHYLGQRLPDYMIPNAFVTLDNLPLTPSGKIDKRALVQMSLDTVTTYQAPRNPLEKQIAAIWQTVLGRDKIGVYDHFFELGGDSIKAIQIVSHLHDNALAAETKDIFLNPSIAQLAACVKVTTNTSQQAEQGIVSGKVPLTAIQTWFFQEYWVEKYHFNHMPLFYAKTGFDETALRTVFDKIQQHHDALRMRYRFDKDSREVSQENVGLDYPFYFEVIDLREWIHPTSERDAYISKIQSSIDLETGPLMKVTLFKQSDGDYLLIVIHHLVIDGVSWRIFLQDFHHGYQQYLAEGVISLPPKTGSFKQWAEKIQAYSVGERLLQQKDYWLPLETIPLKSLKPDYHTTTNSRRELAVSGFQLSETETTQLLTSIHKRYNATINEALLTALAYAMKQWHGENETLIMMAGHGRDEIIADVDSSRTVGWFTSTYPVILNAPDIQEVRHQIKETQNRLNQIPSRMGYSILKYVTPRKLTQPLSFKLKPQVSFNYLGQFDEELNTTLFERVKDAPDFFASADASLLYDMDINGIVEQRQLQIDLAYNQKRYKSETITKILAGFKQKLQAIISLSTTD